MLILKYISYIYILYINATHIFTIVNHASIYVQGPLHVSAMLKVYLVGIIMEATLDNHCMGVCVVCWHEDVGLSLAIRII